MDELIERLVADLGVDRATAEKAVGIIFDFLVMEGSSDKVRSWPGSLEPKPCCGKPPAIMPAASA